MSENQQKNAQTAPPTSSVAIPRSTARRVFWLVLGPLVLGVAGYAYFLSTGRYVSTENAYIKAHKIAISSDVDGRVKHVNIMENQNIDEGYLLFELDPRPFEIALARSEAELGVAAQEVEAYRTAYRQKRAELEFAENSLDFIARAYRRQQALKQKGISSQAEFDEQQHSLQSAQQNVLAAQESLANALARLGNDPDVPTNEHPRYREALSRRDQAVLNKDYATVRAPVSGTVNNVELQAGEYVEAGRPIFSLVSDQTRWVTANIKETEFQHIRIGQSATIRADSYPNRHWGARVESIAPATGAEFALLPAQNASGNWVKVVQRIPVRLSIDLPNEGPSLRAGMSVEVVIDTGYQRPIPKPLLTLWSWLKSLQPTATDVSVASEQTE